PEPGTPKRYRARYTRAGPGPWGGRTRRPPAPGPPDALVQVFAADMRHFEQVLERIAGEPYVERTKSVLVLSPLLRRYSSGSPG
ncbi:Lrp/AsnC ligand binding domain-containing protein, partial [Streptomyces sp. NPDC048332]|uniref:Lrp/AsnC ligand binding domain-containing protein n=1 Tax=Streptomyces sp. NPDC048332 TaxID=3154619 RepID=UPI0034270BA8